MLFTYFCIHRLLVVPGKSHSLPCPDQRPGLCALSCAWTAVVWEKGGFASELTLKLGQKGAGGRNAPKKNRVFPVLSPVLGGTRGRQELLPRSQVVSPSPPQKGPGDTGPRGQCVHRSTEALHGVRYYCHSFLLNNSYQKCSYYRHKYNGVF